jgi:hypothetical protein
MSTTSENILKSLAVLEQNLKEIDSAKTQVSKVVKSSDDLAKVIDNYRSSFEGVSQNIKTVLYEIKTVNLETISALSKQTELFNNEVAKLSNLDFERSFNSVKNEIVSQFEKETQKPLLILEEKAKKFDKEITRLTEFDFSNSIKSIEEKVIEQFEKDLKDRLLGIDEKTKSFGKEVTRLTEFDFSNSIKSIEKKVIEQFEKDLQKQLAVIEEKARNLQDKIDELKNQVSRLEAIDLETHFSTLISEITKQNNEVKQQNETLIKETKTNRKIIIVASVIIIGLLIIELILK